MIQQLLSKYRSFLGYKHLESVNHQQNLAKNLVSDRYYGDFLLRFLVFGWLAFQTYTYYTMADRPLELFAPINWFDKLFMPIFPHWAVWWSVVGTAAFLNFRLIVKGDAKGERIALGFLILWINCIRWKYEFFSHVGHLMVLYHLLGIFIPRKKVGQLASDELSMYAQAIKWLYTGLLVGYTMSGLWKVVGLAYKIVFKPDHINWLHPLAMKLNSIVGYRDWDEPFGDLITLYDVLWPWQIAFILMMLLQIFSVWGGIRTQVTPLIALGNIAFHLINVWLIRIEFYITPMVLILVFFPYHLVFKNYTKESFTKIIGKNLYIRKYADGAEDNYTGFYAFREKRWDNNPLIWGVLYFPGISLLARPFFKRSDN